MAADSSAAEDFSIPLESGAALSARWYRAAPDRARRVTFILAHGAGAGQSHPFMVLYGRELAARGLDIVTFNFPYMEARKHVPDKAPVLEAAFLQVIDAVRSRKVFAGAAIVLGGKSMGGRMASHVAAHHRDAAGPVAGLAFLGYPLHPPGKPDQRRDAHLPSIREPMLFVQGSRDAFGRPEELQPLLASLPAPTELFAIQGGDHSFAVPKSAPLKQADVHAAIFDRLVDWVDRVTAARGA
jgi:predicted alpha/beta-hydrolase family hydrolase